MTNDNDESNIPEEPRAPRNFAMDDQPAETPPPGRRRRRERNFAGQAMDNGADDDVVNPGQAAVDALEAIATASQEGADELKQMRRSGIAVDLSRSRREGTPEIISWELIKRTTEALSFNNYKAFMDLVLCNDVEGFTSSTAGLPQFRRDALDSARAHARGNGSNPLRSRRALPFTDTDGYRLLKLATEAYVTVNSGLPLNSFIQSDDIDDQYESLLNRLDSTDSTMAPGSVQDWWNQYLVTVQASFGSSFQYALPYLTMIKTKLGDLPIKRNIFALDQAFSEDTEAFEERCYGILADRLLSPMMLELIWSYWHEEGMLVQTMGALGRRFQNVHGPNDRDPLAMVEMDPLRPLNNLLWGYIQDEQHRLSVVRRAYEYSHHYGLKLEGKAVPAMRPVDPRSRFLEAFHFLLHQCAQFFRQDDDTTVVADGFPVLNALRDLHLVLSEGAHNQFGDLPTTARIEMLMEQWLLSRPELREFLPRRAMVAYPEPWMDSVDAMKRLQGWTDSSILDFNFLAADGERLLLSVRYTRWTAINDAQLAGIWTRMFRNEIQRYIHSYRAVTGVDLTAQITTQQDRERLSTTPSELMRRRLTEGTPVAGILPAPMSRQLPSGMRERRAARNPQLKG